MVILTYDVIFSVSLVTEAFLLSIWVTNIVLRYWSIHFSMVRGGEGGKVNLSQYPCIVYPFLGDSAKWHQKNNIIRKKMRGEYIFYNWSITMYTRLSLDYFIVWHNFFATNCISIFTTVFTFPLVPGGFHWTRGSSFLPASINILHLTYQQIHIRFMKRSGKKVAFALSVTSGSSLDHTLSYKRR